MKQSQEQMKDPGCGGYRKTEKLATGTGPPHSGGAIGF